jgi:RNA polymerase sigma factor for flagellar operon FliA
MSQVDSACRTPEERERLILEHMRQVQWIAASVHERLPATVLQEDLISAGILGLISAIDNFDASRNASLRTYAEHKIRGAILDSIRALDNLPAYRRRRARYVQSAIEAARQSVEGIPSDADLAAKLKLSVEELKEIMRDLCGNSTMALETGGEKHGSAGPLRYVAGSPESSPSVIVERQALQKLLAQAVMVLPKTERTIVGLYYMEELSLAEIAQVLHVHTSRVSQLKLQAVLRLRAYMQKKWPSGRASQAVHRGE